jgi:selenocysteine lyase/cysteine desulfurase
MMRAMDPFLPDDSKLIAIREVLPSLASGIRLDVTAAGPFPAETDRALHQLAEYELRVGRGGPDRPDELSQRSAEAVSVVAAVMSTTPDMVVLTPGPRAALSGAILAMGPAARGRIGIVGELARPMDAAVSAVAEAHGVPVVRSVNEVPENATLVVAAHVDPLTGRVLDPGPLGERARAAGAALVLDAGWSAGAIPVDARSSGADLVLADAHRWLLGPDGVTALWVADTVAARRVRGLIDPMAPAQLMAVARSVGWLLMYVGLPWAFQRTESLATRLRDALAVTAGVRTTAPDRGLAATVPFSIASWRVDEAAAELTRRAHAMVEVDAAKGMLLASVGAWLREEEVDRFVAAVAEIAAHTPETLPRRPLLTVLAPARWDER